MRVSGKGQINGDGFPRQREAIARYAKTHGIELVAEYTDKGVSGGKELEARLRLEGAVGIPPATLLGFHGRYRVFGSFLKRHIIFARESQSQVRDQ